MNSWLRTYASCIFFLGCVFSVSDLAAQETDQLDRHEFAKAIASLSGGTPAETVIKLVGKPDDVLTKQDPGGISTTRTKEIWCYGTDGHLSTATLGKIYIDDNDQVQYIYGGRGTPPDQTMFDEEELRIVLRLLDKVPSYNSGFRYDPIPVIRAVNALHPLGKKKAIAAIREHLRVSSSFHSGSREGMFLVMKVLFRPPGDATHHRRMLVGAASTSNHKDKSLLPCFPVVLVADVPLLMVEGYMLAGLPEQPEKYLAYCESGCDLRTKLLEPQSDVIEKLEQFLSSRKSPFGNKGSFGYTDMKRGKHLLREQVLTALNSVIDIKPDSQGYRLSFSVDGDAHEKVIADAQSRIYVWNTELDLFTFGDGSVLPTGK